MDHFWRSGASHLYVQHGREELFGLAGGHGGGEPRAVSRSRLLSGEGASSLADALLYLDGSPQVPGSLAEAVQFEVRDFASPDPCPKPDPPTPTDEGEGYIGAFGPQENWLEAWTVFGPESVYDLRNKEVSPLRAASATGSGKATDPPAAGNRSPCHETPSDVACHLLPRPLRPSPPCRPHEASRPAGNPDLERRMRQLLRSLGQWPHARTVPPHPTGALQLRRLA